MAKSLRTDLTEIGKDVARLDGRISQLPTTMQMLGFILAVLAISGLVRVPAP